MQLTYNTQNLIGCGCYEPNDSGLTYFGADVITEMNRHGVVIDLSHTGERTSMDAIEASTQPVAITHANPTWWKDVQRNKSDDMMRALAENGGVMGLGTYPNLFSPTAPWSSSATWWPAPSTSWASTTWGLAATTTQASCPTKSAIGPVAAGHGKCPSS